jgi:hypothetical protein
MSHVVTILPNPHADHSRFKFENVCSCQWQSLCMSLELAESYAAGHLRNHGIPLEAVKDYVVLPKTEEPESVAEATEGGAPVVAPEPEPRPLFHPEGTAQPKVLVTPPPKVPDDLKV